MVWQKILVRGQDDPVQPELDHRLGTVDRRELAKLIMPVRDIHPFQDVAVVNAIAIVSCGDIQREFRSANVDLGTERQPRRIGQHAALMLWIAVEHIDAGTDNPGRIECWPDLAEPVRGPRQQILSCLVDTGDDKVAVHHHHCDRNIIQCRHRVRTGGVVAGSFGLVRRDTEQSRQLAIVTCDRDQIDAQVNRAPASRNMGQTRRCCFAAQHLFLKLPKPRVAALRVGQKRGIRLAQDCFGCGPQQGQEILVHVEHLAVQPQFDQRLRVIECGHALLHFPRDGASVAAGPA